MKKVTIIGSGLAAVTAARYLIKNNIKVDLITSELDDSKNLATKSSYSARLNSKISESASDYLKKAQIKNHNHCISVFILCRFTTFSMVYIEISIYTMDIHGICKEIYK